LNPLQAILNDLIGFDPVSRAGEVYPRTGAQQVGVVV